MNMRRGNGICRTLTMAMALAPPLDGAAGSLGEALAEGKATLDVRYRYERVDQANALHDADASTVRSRLGYGSGKFYGLRAYL